MRKQSVLWPDGDDLPLFSGTPVQATDDPYRATDRPTAPRLPGMPVPSWDELQQHQERQRRRSWQEKHHDDDHEAEAQ